MIARAALRLLVLAAIGAVPWIVVIVPDTPDRGDLAPYPTVHQGDVAATLLKFFALDPRAFNPRAGPPIPAALADPGKPR